VSLQGNLEVARVAVNLQAKGLEEDETENLANKAYYEFSEEEKLRELKDSYAKPLIPFQYVFSKQLLEV